MRKALQRTNPNWPRMPPRCSWFPSNPRNPFRTRLRCFRRLRNAGSIHRVPVRCGFPATGEPGGRRNAPPGPCRSAGSCGSDRRFPPLRWPRGRRSRRRIRTEANRDPNKARDRSTRSPLRRPTNRAAGDEPEAGGQSADAAWQAPAEAPAADPGAANCSNWIACETPQRPGAARSG